MKSLLLARFQPESIEFQLAWLIAYNENLFSDDLAYVKKQLRIIKEMLPTSDLTLGSPREQWLNTLTIWLGQND